ncbi:hypothetical protein EV189_1417 [Motilibacter rhizosphaerae]|uniref:DUF5666 domain-containing protein n=1 Tax=Motilibacter rhizosphaerae TaxID=598652 RepID=A0A4Q7NRF3_9ACTN|nr:hypothetical protein [Motilibacter rhizosphaerae]RZS89646.1 hypothetical protein EV189_1417 [Motilibacter rhizosphaerae]
MAAAHRRSGTGRVVRWDAHGRTGAVVVDGVPAEVEVPGSAVDAPGGRALEVGELVEVVFEPSEDGPAYVAVRACPTDEGPD